MAEIVKNWDNGGSFSVVFTGDGDGTAVISSTENEGDEREAEVSFIDSSRNVVVVRRVVQAAMSDISDADYLNMTTFKPWRFRFPNELEYSYDKITWHTLPAHTWCDVNASEYIYLRGNLRPKPQEGIGTFEIDTIQRIEVSGNVLSLIFGGRCDSVRDLTGYDYAFYKLFYNCNVVADIYMLYNVDILSPYCFAYMFAGDYRHGNVFDFEIPDFERLAPYCFYNFMTNLGMELYEQYCTISCTTTAPHCFDSAFKNTELVGMKMMFEELTEGCCENMFNGCGNLSYINTQMLTAPNETFCLNWVDGVSESGQFIKRGDAEWEDVFGVSAIPEGWDVSSGGALSPLFSTIFMLIEGAEVYHELFEYEDMGLIARAVIAMVRLDGEVINRPFLIPATESGGIIPWSVSDLSDSGAAILDIYLAKLEEPPYIGLLYDVRILVNDFESDSSFEFMDLSKFDFETGEFNVSFAIYTNGVRMSEDSVIYGLSEDEYYILDITEDYIIFSLYYYYSLHNILSTGLIFNLYTE